MINVTWFPAGDRSFASSRLRVWKIADALTHSRVPDNPIGRANITAQIPSADNTDVMVVQKRFDLDDQMIRWVSEGKRVIWDCDDYIPYPNLPEGVIVTVDTAYKRKLYPNATIIPDALDLPDDYLVKTHHADELRNIVVCVNAENLPHTRNAAAACERLHLDLTIITDLRKVSWAYFDGVQGIQWDVNTVEGEIIKADIAICPFMFDTSWGLDWVNSKSANKVLKAWGLGLPVVGTPIPSYVDIGLLYQATTIEQWIIVLELLGNVRWRYRDAQRGIEIANRYRADIIAKQWMDVFEGKL